MLRELPHDMATVEQAGEDEAYPGKMLHFQQSLFAEPAITARDGEAQPEKPYIETEHDSADTGGLGINRIIHQIMRHEVGGQDDPKEQHSQVAHDADETGGKG